MIQKLMRGALVLCGVVVPTASGATVQTPPLVWDGVVVPTSGNCTLDTPTAWRATYRPYMASTVNTAPSQLVVYTNYQRNDFGFRMSTGSTVQFNGGGSTNKFFVGSELNDVSQSNTGGPTTVTYNLTQSPPLVKAITTYVKITGTMVNGDSSPGLGCASAFIGVFTPRKQATQ